MLLEENKIIGNIFVLLECPCKCFKEYVFLMMNIALKLSLFEVHKFSYNIILDSVLKVFFHIVLSVNVLV